ncbi:16S rRNA (uracil(1498)-N(3))-methyltransferase [Thiolapillus sp.]|uniref:16S rRNA (uracil(1498)-N(3))-methyltransferase n=1 Tax=Thiolapillus sp. TaxID=2017437 RepID=UPI002600721A|nr:16S rRNA (uracil(1498)-N(3))-methyltransferase [Thiolapillus sp.]
MRLPRNWVPDPLAAGSDLQLPANVARHLRQVLRMQTGQEIILFNGQDGRDYRARLIQVDRKAVSATIIGATEPEPDPRLSIRLALGISRGERMDLAIQKSVELGVQQITPLFSERTQVRLSGPRRDKRMQHWQAVIISACEQSGRRRIPELHPAESFSSWLEQREENVLFMDPDAVTGLSGIVRPTSELCFLIGPEGGFSEAERKAALAAGCRAVRLGPRILRTETAPLAAIAAAQALWGDFL